jgi:hypothetical protein
MIPALSLLSLLQLSHFLMGFFPLALLTSMTKEDSIFRQGDSLSFRICYKYIISQLAATVESSDLMPKLCPLIMSHSIQAGGPDNARQWALSLGQWSLFTQTAMSSVFSVIRVIHAKQPTKDS